MASVHITPPPLSPQSMADLLCTIMLLCRGKNPQGKPFWAYMCIKPSMAKAFKDARDSGNFDLEDYGTVIEWGDGAEPPTDTKSRMEREFGVNHRYEDELIQVVEALKQKANG